MKNYLFLGILCLSFVFLGFSSSAFVQATPSIDVEGHNVGYSITGGSILSIAADVDANSLFIKISTTSNGQLTITLPRALIDAKKIDGTDDTFFILINSEENPYTETQNDANTRTITIRFEETDSDIEIIGTFVVDSGGGSTTQPSITVSTDRYSYNEGDTIRISGKVSDIISGNPVSMHVFSPNGLVVTVQQLDVSYSGSFSTELTAGGSLWEDSGTYKIKVLYRLATKTTEIYFIPPPGFPIIYNKTPPIILQPKDIVVDAKTTYGDEDSSGIRVNFEVLAIDDVDEIVKPSCTPSSGSFFLIGITKVVCSAYDSSGNAAQQKTFLITVNPPAISIPYWIKEVAAFWCDDKIDDSSFIEGIQYLIDNDIIIIIGTTTVGSGGQEIPSWIKNNACWWSQGLISDSDFAQGIQWLIQEGIIQV